MVSGRDSKYPGDKNFITFDIKGIPLLLSS